MKTVTFDPMQKMLKGFDIAANAVVGTLGPMGRNVFIDDALTPKITNDGATIAQNIVLTDKVENMGAYLIRNTSSQTNDDAGDGTTTTAVLLQAIVHECLKRPENPMFIRQSIKEAGEKILRSLAKLSVKIDKKDIERVALISSEDKKIAQIISDIINKLGEKAIINVEDSRTFDTEYEIVDGYEANVGFMSPHFINNTKRARVEMSNVPVFVTEKKINSLGDVTPLFEQFKSKGITSCVIVAEDIENPMLGVFVASKLTGQFNAVVIKAVGDLLKDIEATVGATRVSDETGVTFQNIQIEHLGHVDKLVCDANKTLFMARNDKQKHYATQLEQFVEEETNMYVKRKLADRVAKLRGGVAVLRIGASTDFEREYLKLKAEDAVKAARAALEEGVVDGGGMALWQIAQAIQPKTVGESILKKALTAPLKKIIENAGKDYAEIVKAMPKGMGYDAKKDTFAPMMEVGIIDPSKVERCALENAISAAGTFITTFATISDYVEPKTD